MRRSQSFASAPTDSDALFRLAFAPARGLQTLNLASEEQLVGSLCKRHAVTLTGSHSLQARGFRYYFTPLLAVLFTFPSRYWYTIGLTGVFSLTGWSRQIHAGLLVSRATQDTARPCIATNTGISPSMTELSRSFFSQYTYHSAVLQPRTCARHTPGLGSSPVARHYWGNHSVIFSSSGY